MIIPYRELEKDTLQNLIADFVSREGTDNGFDQDQDSRIRQVMQLLKSGEVAIVFDPETESVNILPAQEAKACEDLLTNP